jgi:hypothetical protein
MFLLWRLDTISENQPDGQIRAVLPYTAAIYGDFGPDAPGSRRFMLTLSFVESDPYRTSAGEVLPGAAIGVTQCEACTAAWYRADCGQDC